MADSANKYQHLYPKDVEYETQADFKRPSTGEISDYATYVPQSSSSCFYSATQPVASACVALYCLRMVYNLRPNRGCASPVCCAERASSTLVRAAGTWALTR